MIEWEVVPGDRYWRRWQRVDEARTFQGTGVLVDDELSLLEFDANALPVGSRVVIQPPRKETVDE